jgi:predicted P-loop ATPase
VLGAVQAQLEEERQHWGHNLSCRHYMQLHPARPLDRRRKNCSVGNHLEIPYWPNAEFEKNIISVEQEARYEPDAWEDAISFYLQDKQEVLVSEIAERALDIPKRQFGTSERNRITAVLESLGWVHGNRVSKRRPWVRPHDA